VFLSHAGPTADGTLILFTSARKGQLEVYAMNLEGWITHQFTHGEGNDFNGVWRPVVGP
jgi:Tol biopolymer transport system component